MLSNFEKNECICVYSNSNKYIYIYIYIYPTDLIFLLCCVFFVTGFLATDSHHYHLAQYIQLVHSIRV